VFIGITSYSTYIAHEVIIATLHDNVPGGRALHGLLYVAVTLIFVTGMYYWVERPCARIRKRLSRARPAEASGPPLAPSGLRVAPTATVRPKSVPAIIRPVEPSVQPE
jgi:peptidoglycan/LPS O-acetylase OafA/YrhL